MPFFSLANISKRMGRGTSKLNEFLQVFEKAAREMKPIEVTEYHGILLQTLLWNLWIPWVLQPLVMISNDFQALSGKGSVGLQVMGTVPFLTEEANKQQFMPFRKYMTFLTELRNSKKDQKGPKVLKDNMAL